MIQSVSITDPIDWLEKTSKADLAKVCRSSLHPSTPDGFSEDLSLPNLHGKTFNFAPGLNVIVGPNGSGKSSLLSIISKVCCCDTEMSSTFDRNGITRTYSEGIYTCCKVKANYNLSTFRFTSSVDLTESNNGLSLANGLTKMKTSEKSKGQAQMISIESLLAYYRSDGRLIEGSNELGLMDFNERVVNPASTCHPSSSLETAIAYYHDNMVTDSNAVTFIMDSPDDHLDIPNQRLLFNLLLQAVKNPEKYQFIVSLNSLLLFKSIATIDEVNWIDLEGDYLMSVINVHAFSKAKNKDKPNDVK